MPLENDQVTWLRMVPPPLDPPKVRGVEDLKAIEDFAASIVLHFARYNRLADFLKSNSAGHC